MTATAKRYQSNLICPDLRPCFPHASVGVNWGHEFLIDDDFQPPAGYISDDEAAILWNIAHQIGGDWLEIGGHTGWSAAHIATAGTNSLLTMEPRLRERYFFWRWSANIERVKRQGEFGSKYPWLRAAEIQPYAGRSDEYSACDDHDLFDGAFIDGDHNDPMPQFDAQLALARLRPKGVIVFHDFGGPVADAVDGLLHEGLRCRVYDTPQMVAVCWRGSFVPPDHVPDTDNREGYRRRRETMGFDFGRCE